MMQRRSLDGGKLGENMDGQPRWQVARALGYHAGLLSLAALKGAGEDELIAHAQMVAREIPLVGFYLQPAVGGLVLPVSFWRRFAAIENVVAIKIAPFNRYRTLDVVRGTFETIEIEPSFDAFEATVEAVPAQPTTAQPVAA